VEWATVSGSSADIGSSVNERLLKGAGAQGFAQAVRVIIRLAEVPLFLAFWGTQLYGEWLIVAAIPAYFALGDLGFIGTASRDITIRAGAGDRAGALSVFQSTWVLVLSISLGAALLAGLAATVIPFESWFRIETIGANELATVILILAVHVFVSFQAGLLYGGYCAEGRYGFGTLLDSITQFIEFGGVAIAVVLGGGPVQAASGLLAGRIIGLVLMRVALLRVAPWLHYGWSVARQEHVKRLFGPAIASVAFPLGNALNIQGMRLVVGVSLGPVMVAVFSTLLTLSRVGLQVTHSVSRLIEPELGLAFGRGDRGSFRLIIRRSCQVTWWGGLVICLTLWLTGEELLGVWTHDQIAMEWPLFAFLLVAVALNAFWYAALGAAYATNRYGRIALGYILVYGIGALILAYLSMQFISLAGAGAALALVEFAMAVLVIPAALRLSEDNVISWARTVGQPPWFLLRRLWRGSTSGLL
jgi:O-antigen/teichoic acid export membrane protein